MAYTIDYGLNLTAVAGEDLSDKQYYWVEMRSDGLIYRCNANSDIPLGILQNNPVAGETATVRFGGVSMAVLAASENIPAGAMVGCSAAGTTTQISPTATGPDVGAWIAGQLLQAGTGSASASTRGTVLIRPNGRVTV